MIEKPRAACYCRISSDPKDKREGVGRQREDTATLCELKGWKVADIYVDNDRSASNGKGRPEWERLLADIEAGKIDAVAAWDQDRVNRMMEDFIAYKKLFVKRGILLATSNNGDIDLSHTVGVLTATIKTAVSEHEVAMMKIRMKRAARQTGRAGHPEVEEGVRVRSGPHGDNCPRRAASHHQPDPVTAPMVREAYTAILAGGSITEIARTWNTAGDLRVDRQAVDRVDCVAVPAGTAQRRVARPQRRDRAGHRRQPGEGHLARTGGRSVVAFSASGAQRAGSGTGTQDRAQASADRGAPMRQVLWGPPVRFADRRDQADRLQLQGVSRCQRPRRARRTVAHGGHRGSVGHAGCGGSATRRLA